MGIDAIKKLFSQGKGATDIEPNEPLLDRNLTMKYSGRHRGSVRLSTGRYYTREEWEKRRIKLGKISLP